MLKILFSISPAILILLFFYFKDKFREPPIHVFQAFFLGIMIVLPVVLVNEIFYYDFCWNKIQGSYFGKSVYNHLSRVAFQEELWKFLILFFFFSHLMEEPMDGIVYGVAVSLGFSAYENIDYVLYFEKDPSFDIALVRSFTAIPMHALCGVIMGFLISQSIFEKKHNYLNLFLALFIPVGMHGLYNFSFSSTLVSYQVAYFILIIFSIRAYLIFKNLKIRQKQSIIFNKRYYNISITSFINISTNILIIYLVLNYLINLIN